MKQVGVWGLVVCAAALSGGCPRPAPGTDSATAAPDSGPGPGSDALPGTDATAKGTDGALPGTDAAPGTDATPPPMCGNGVVEPPEACDDGNLTSGDGCDVSCMIEGPCSGGTLLGPDGFGYAGCASTPAMLPCDDITLTGTDALLIDDSWIYVPIGFSFDFYGTAASSVSIGSNGNLNFADLYLGNGNVCIPGSSTFTPTQFIAAFWDDLDPGAGGAVRYELLGVAPDRRFVVQWNTAVYGGTSTDTLDVRAVLHETTNAIDLCYVDTSVFDAAYNFGIGATAGLQESTSAGLGYSCNMSLLTNGLHLHYDHP